jgi:hypothetical protein
MGLDAMSAASDREIADLNATLAQDGMTIELRSTTPGTSNYFSIQARAFVRRFRPEELVGGITQSHREIIISPTEIIAQEWPGPVNSGSTSGRDLRVPKKGDKAVIEGRIYNIEDAAGIYLGDDGLCRIEIRALG